MANEDFITPEKQLLKLIEDPASKTNIKAEAVKRTSLGLFSFGALKGRLSFFKHKFGKDFKNKSSYALDISLLNTGLKSLLFLLSLYFIIHLVVTPMKSKNLLNLEDKTENSTQAATIQPVASLLRASSYYLEKVRERDIFRMAPKKQTDIKIVTSKIIEATKNFKLVGIAWSDDPDVMIEETVSKRTFFLKKGQMISNVKLEGVFKDRVILSYEGEEIELR
ncbi:MAG: hypothetical protein NTW64_02820 [Candidatus Omnitrophica bacterium]|nr:hypothetical protein [Candidatus Omnitrophota bacterium]